jgi:arabinogalactan endo-1,4-beta-galactosidase
MASRYNKVMVVEVGGIDEQIENIKCINCRLLKTCQITKGWVLFIGQKLVGYSLSAWQNDGKPSAALNAFKNNGQKINLVNTFALELFHLQMNTVLAMDI